MAKHIRIGHAFGGETGDHNQNPGDSKQTTGPNEDDLRGEVRIDEWYINKNKGNWVVVYRPKSPLLAEKSALACEAGCNNSCIGYDKTNRGTLNSELNKIKTGKTYTYLDIKRLTTKCECDCSSFMNVCAVAGGANLSYTGIATSSMVGSSNIYTKSGDYQEIRDPAYLTTDALLKRGDIVARNGHTFMVLGNGPCAGLELETGLEFTVAADTLKIGLLVNNIKINNQQDSNKDMITGASASAEVTVKKISEKKEISATKADIDLYSWSIELTSGVDNITKKNSFSFSDKEAQTGKKIIDLSDLTCDTVYKVQVVARLKAADTTDIGAKISSPNVMFTTPADCPTAVRDFKATFDKNGGISNINISFKNPQTWKNLNSSQKRGYRIFLLANGKIVAYNDNIFSEKDINVSENTTISKNINLEKTFAQINFTTKNQLQLGIVPFIYQADTTVKDILFDLDYLVTSGTFYTYLIKGYSLINKVFTLIEKTCKRVIVHKFNQGGAR